MDIPYNLRKMFAYQTFIQRENENNHHTYDEESEIYECIRQGDKSKMQPLLDMFVSKRTGKLSDDPLMNCRYHFVASIAVITRIAISCGVEPDACYTMSDLYIQRMDECSSVSEIKKLHEHAVSDFVEKSAAVRRNRNYSRPVRKCMDYIYENLHKRITVEELSECAELTQSYLSVLFKKETGSSISGYIRKKRIEAAQDMLKYSEYSCSEISSYLSFSSVSHFISLFRKMTGLTTNEYRKKYFRDTLNLKE